MRKAVIPLLLLVFCLLACNVPAQIVTPTPVNTPAATLTLVPSLTPTATIVSEYPVITVPVQAIRVRDDDGGRSTKITGAQVAAWVSKANEIYAWSGIQFTYSGHDPVSIYSTLLNNINGVEDQNWFEEVAYADQVAAQYPDKLVVFFRWGPGAQPTGGAFSWIDYNFVAMPGFDNTYVCGYQNIGVLAHEIGHYLGLIHTFSGGFNSLVEAEAALESTGNNPAIFDADGLSDTPPDPFIALDEYQCQPVPGVTLNGTFFPVPRDNIMSYYEVRTGLSEMQIVRARWILSMRMAHGMSMPKNAQTPDPVEAQDMSPLSSGCSTGIQVMSAWGKEQWYNGDQIFVSSSQNCTVALGLPVKTAGRYRLDLYLTSTPDFGIIQVSLDGTPVGEPIDLYTPIVMPTGAIPIGSFDLTQQIHLLTFKVVGTNEKSNNYSFGLDCFSLVPQP